MANQAPHMSGQLKYIASIQAAEVQAKTNQLGTSEPKNVKKIRYRQLRKGINYLWV